MKIRILKAMAGVMDGRSLTQFLPGSVYDVPDSFGAQLVAMGIAIEVRATDPPTSPDDETDLDRLDGGVHVIRPDTADERPERRRRKRR